MQIFQFYTNIAVRINVELVKTTILRCVEVSISSKEVILKRHCFGAAKMA